MTAHTFWVLLEPSLVNIAFGIVLGIAGIALLNEYRRIFMQDPRAAMSAEVLFTAILRAGGPGYLAAFLLAGAVLNFALAIISGIYNFNMYFSAVAR